MQSAEIIRPPSGRFRVSAKLRFRQPAQQLAYGRPVGLEVKADARRISVGAC
jgi:hypothetical protein